MKKTTGCARHDRADSPMVASTAVAAADWKLCRKQLTAGARSLGVRVTPGARAAMIAYLRELASWNRTHNLTGVREPRAMVARHLLDSLAVTDCVTGATLADIGSGAGLPGIVLAIARPRLAVTLIEANAKKAAFLRHARRRLKLDNVTVVQARVEAWRPEARFDCVICRALAKAGESVRLAGPVLARDGRLLLMKGRDPAAELDALPGDLRHVETRPLRVPGVDGPRHLVIVEPGLI